MKINWWAVVAIVFISLSNAMVFSIQSTLQWVGVGICIALMGKD